jgi:hypothetical protein
MGGTMFGGNQVNDAGLQQVVPGVPGAANTGAGGSGAAINQVAVNPGEVLGGNGGSGVCIVTEWCWGSGAVGGGGAPVANWPCGFDD